MSLEVLQEALAGVEGKIEVAAPKIPEGMTLIAIRMDRDEKVSNLRTEGINRDWLEPGWAIAIKNGHVVEANAVYGRFTHGLPKVSAVHWLKCSKCGGQVLMPVEVWRTKDVERKKGNVIPDDMPGSEVLVKWGACPSCGAKWQIDGAYEKDSLAAFKDEVLTALGAMPEVPPWVPPTAFLVKPRPTPDIPGWEWVSTALRAKGEGACLLTKPLQQGENPRMLIYNPGFWLGYIEDRHHTGLFWVENGKTKRESRGDRGLFNPKGVNGL